MAFTLSRTAALGTAFVFLLNSMVLALLPVQTAKASSIYDDLLKNADSVGVAFNYDLHKPHAGVTGHTNDRCHDTDHKDMFNWGWITRLIEGRDRKPEGQTKNDLTEMINMIQSGSGGYGVIRNSDEGTTDYGYISTTIVAWYGTANLNWASDKVTLNAGSNNLRYTTLVPQCNYFDTSDPPPFTAVGSVNKPSSGQLRIDNLVAVPGQVGSVFASPRRSIYFMSGNINFNYPSGYAGAIIRQQAPDQEGMNDMQLTLNVYPDRLWAHAGGRVFAFDPLTRECELTRWVFKYYDSSDPYNNDFQSDIYSDEDWQELPNLANYEYYMPETNKDKGYYLLKAKFDYDKDNPDCLEEPARSTFEDRKAGFKTTVIRFSTDWVNELHLDSKGSVIPCKNDVFEGENVRVCDAINETMLLQDCSQYGWAEGFERLGCEIHNLWIKFVGLWRPSPNFIQSKIDQLNANIQDNNSVLVYGTKFIAGVVTAITTSSGEDCSVTVSNIWGQSSNLNACSLKDRWPAAWNLAAITTRIAVVFTLISSLYAIYFRTWSDSE